MRAILVFFWFLLAASPALMSQIELVSGDYFPADLEFAEIHKVTSSKKFDDASHLAKIEDGDLISDVGFSRYAGRVYSAGDSGSLSIEILTLQDSRAAYSLVTLLRDGAFQEGPPGDAYTTSADGIRFCQGKFWIRIRGERISQNLLRGVATSVTNRIGARRAKSPPLVSYLPKEGLNPASVRYFPGLKSYRTYSAQSGGRVLTLAEDAEIARAAYSLEGRGGTLTLLSFPTAEVAEEYFDGLAGRAESKLFLKKAGPIVGILEGSWDSGTADSILRNIRYTYSVQWVYEKGAPSGKTVWGVPAGILTTVVKSLFFVGILSGASILAGIGFAVFRVVLRRRAQKKPPDRPDENEIIRLRLR